METGTKPSAYRWTTLFLAWLIYFAFGMIIASIPAFMPLIIADLGLTYTEGGMILGAWQLTYIGTALVVGLLIDRIGTYRSLVLGLSAITISAALRGVASSFSYMFLAVAVFGIGGPVISIGLPKLVASLFSGKERGVASGIYVTGSTAGNAVSYAMANSFLLPLTGSWQNGMFAYSAIALLVLIVWLTAGARSAKLIAKEDRLQEKSTSLHGAASALLRRRGVWLTVLIGLSYFFVTHGLRNWLPEILESEGFTPTAAGYISSTYAALSIVGSVLLPTLSYYVQSRRRLLVLMLIMSSAGLCLTASHLGAVMGMGLILNGIATGGILPLTMVVLMELPEVGPIYMGTASGLYFMIGEVGGFSAPLLIGYLWDATGSYIPGIWALIAMAIAMVPVAALIKETHREKGHG